LREDFDCQANFDDSDETEGADSTTEDAYEYSIGSKPNSMDCGVQTSQAHFKRISKSKAFKQEQEDKAFNTDYAYSSLFNDLQMKQPKTKNELDEIDEGL